MVSFLTGTASFIYEVSWIRMLSLLLGSSTHSFEIMLAAFILGLALGSLWIRKKIDRTASPLILLATIQILMGTLAAATLPVYAQSFKLMQWLIETLERTNTGYFLYLLSSSGFAIAVMLPAAFCAGMTLPLITRILLDEKGGEENIGYVYGMNTAGAIIGVVGAVHLGMTHLGLKGLVLFGAGIDISLGCLLILISLNSQKIPKKIFVTTLASLGVFGAIAVTTHLDEYMMASGVFRFGDLLDKGTTEILYHQDGKTATISVYLRNKNHLTLSTNGKAEGSLGIGPNAKMISSDNPTQTLVAVIPMALQPDAKVAATIGMGSGITSSVLLNNPYIKRLDTVEIEPLVLEAARHFGKPVQSVYDDHRSHIHVEDARTFFAKYPNTYDIIISEPSNPWVSGVANLFTQEFYQSVHNALNDDGIFAQWIQLYEINTDLLASIVKAFSDIFPDYQLYAPSNYDLVFIARKAGKIDLLSQDILSIPGIQKRLDQSNVESPRDITMRWLGSNTTMQPFFSNRSLPMNSDYNPIIDQQGARTRFLMKNVVELTGVHYSYFNLANLLEKNFNPVDHNRVTITPSFPKISKKANLAFLLRDYYSGKSTAEDKNKIPPKVLSDAKILQDMCRGIFSLSDNNRLPILFHQGQYMLPYLSTAEFDEAWSTLGKLGARNNLTPHEYTLFSLFNAINSGDGLMMQSLAMNLLMSGIMIPDFVTDFLIASSMVGDLLNDNHVRADKLWKTYKKNRFGQEGPPLFFLIVAAHLQSSLNQQENFSGD